MNDSYSLITSLVTGFGLALPFGYCFERFLRTPALVGYICAGLAVGFWGGREEIRALRQTDRLYRPDMDGETRERLLRGWHKAVGRAQSWAEPDI